MTDTPRFGAGFGPEAGSGFGAPAPLPSLPGHEIVHEATGCPVRAPPATLHRDQIGPINSGRHSEECGTDPLFAHPRHRKTHSARMHHGLTTASQIYASSGLSVPLIGGASAP